VGHIGEQAAANACLHWQLLIVAVAFRHIACAEQKCAGGIVYVCGAACASVCACSKRAPDQAAAKPCGEARERTARSAAVRHRQQGALRGQDTEALRDALPGLGLIAFVGDGAILPRHAPPQRYRFVSRACLTTITRAIEWVV